MAIFNGNEFFDSDKSISLEDLLYIRKLACEIISKYKSNEQGRLTGLNKRDVKVRERELILILNQLIEQKRGD